MSHTVPVSIDSLVFFDKLPTLDPVIKEWLFLASSMTQKLAQHCQTLRVAVHQEGFTTTPAPDEARLLPATARYWSRDIILYADDAPWLMAHSLIPQTTLNAEARWLPALGHRPLGEQLFRHPRLSRNLLQIGKTGPLWGRRARLTLSEKPLLITELFLAASPLYHKVPTCQDA